jgi:hypothetical protein
MTIAFEMYACVSSLVDTKPFDTSRQCKLVHFSRSRQTTASLVANYLKLVRSLPLLGGNVYSVHIFHAYNLRVQKQYHDRLHIAYLPACYD